jgi:hypothetical protein
MVIYVLNIIINQHTFQIKILYKISLRNILAYSYVVVYFGRVLLFWIG